MTWKGAAQAFFFRQGDEAFLEFYASDGLRRTLAATPDLVTPLRGLLDAISSLVPAGAHVCRDWKGAQPLVVIGSLSPGLRISRAPDVPRIGLRLEANAFRLFADEMVVAAHDTAGRASWEFWADGMTCLSGGLSVADCQPAGRAHRFLVAVGELIDRAGQRAAVAPKHRVSLGEPPEMEMTCIYPRLDEAARQQSPAPVVAGGHAAPIRIALPGGRPQRRPAGGTAPGGDAAPSVTPAPEPVGDRTGRRGKAPRAGDPHDLLGAVYRAAGGALHTEGPQPRAAFRAWFNALPQETEVLSLVCGPPGEAGTIAAVLNDIVWVHHAFANPGFFGSPEPPASAADAYVYLYFRTCAPTWGNVFYIGMKGAGRAPGIPRQDQHIDDSLDRNSRSLPLTRKEQLILGEMPTVAHHAGMAAILNYNDYLAARPALLAAQHALTRKLRVFTGHGAAARAFCTEYHLISSLYGAFAVSNDTSGNRSSGQIQIISRPKAYSGTSHHVQWWGQACAEFIDFKDASAAARALLRAMALEALVPAFEREWLDPGRPLHGLIGPDPSGATPALASPVLPHVYVANGQDATVNYRVLARCGGARIEEAGLPVPVQSPPFRLELRDKATTPAVRINLRPASGGAAGFRQHIRQRVGACYPHDPISIPTGNYSFFKPFAPAANGDFDTNFEMVPIRPGAYSRTIGGSPGYCWPDWHPDGHQLPHLALNIGEAIEAILTHLLP